MRIIGGFWEHKLIMKQGCVGDLTAEKRDMRTGGRQWRETEETEQQGQKRRIAKERQRDSICGSGFFK